VRHLVIGAGPAGLTIARQLVRAGPDHEVQVLEADPTYVGGLSRTVTFRGHRFDIGGHRFSTKSAPIDALWHEMLPGGFVEVPRLSRIHYDGRFFPYPVELGPTLRTLGPRRSAVIVASYLRARLRPRRPEVSFEDWIVNRFGHELYRTFFKTYTEKVWGMPCTEISKGLRCPADPGPDPRRGGRPPAAGAMATRRRRRRGRQRPDQDPDRPLRLPPARPRPTVGGGPRPRRGPGRHRDPGPTGGRRPPRPRGSPGHRPHHRRRHPARRRPRLLDDDPARPGSAAGPGTAGRGGRGGAGPALP
jgi:hypothetical protein